jgi:hypothetical protein
MSKRRLPSSLMLLALALIACAFLPALRTLAAVWWCAGLGAMLAALAAQVTNVRRGAPVAADNGSHV